MPAAAPTGSPRSWAITPRPPCWSPPRWFRTPSSRRWSITARSVYGEERHPELPDTPTAKELGYDVVSCLDNIWYAPAGTPDDVVEKLAGVFEMVSGDAELIDKIEAKGDEVLFVAGDALRDRLASIYDNLAAVAGELQ
ncbi:MAG: hypothetical protein EP318_03345 [Rhodobacteraceae bacterium]|nr:MAG: hypothetical protein EP318_03345 [Paracoccaceae bacterium]